MKAQQRNSKKNAAENSNSNLTSCRFLFWVILHSLLSADVIA